MTVDAALALAMKWLKIASVLILLVFIVLTALKLFGVNIFPVVNIGWQELGVFLAGTAYALKNL